MTDLDSDPFALDLFGGSPKMETCASAISTGATTAPENPSALAISSSVQGTRSSCDQPVEMPLSPGAFLDIGKMSKKELSAACSGMKGRTSRRSLSDKLTPSLITAGLVCGITPSSTRKQSGQPILVLAFDMPGGGAAASQQKGCSFSSATSEAAA